jgi:flavodoxin
MNGLILYRSHYGNTKTVADALAADMMKLGHRAEVRDLRLSLPDLKDINWALIGTPTRMGRATWKARWALRRLRWKGFGNRPIGIFDTYGPVPDDPQKYKEDEKWFLPGAAGMLRARAQRLGLNVFPDTLRCRVRESKGPLKEGEPERAARFAGKFISFILESGRQSK